jgi:hypothetical protein
MFRLGLPILAFHAYFTCKSQCNYLLVSTKDTVMCASLSERQLANIPTRKLNRPKIYTGLRLVLVPRPVIDKSTY